MRQPLVRFVVAGMQKAGTTALHHYLCSHQELFLPPQKELHFFDNEVSVDWDNPNYDEYEINYFNNKNKICGEVTPIYSFWPNSLERIYAYNSNMKFILMIRDRAERAYSHWAMEASRGFENLSFSDAIRSGRNRYNHIHVNSRMNRIVSYVERGFYAPQINRIFSLFGKNNLLIINNESLLFKPENTLRLICDFLLIDDFDNTIETVFIRPIKLLESLDGLSNEDRQYLNSLYVKDVSELSKLDKYII